MVKNTLYLEKWIRIIAGCMVLFSVFLGLFVNKWWFALTIFVAGNLIQSDFTDICPAETILKK